MVNILPPDKDSGEQSRALLLFFCRKHVMSIHLDHLIESVPLSTTNSLFLETLLFLG